MTAHVDGKLAKRAAGAYVADPSLPAADRFTTGTDVRLRKVSTGEYEVVFLGLSPLGAGTTLGIQVVDQAEFVSGNRRYQAFCSIDGTPSIQAPNLTVRVRCFHEDGHPGRRVVLHRDHRIALARRGSWRSRSGWHLDTRP